MQEKCKNVYYTYGLHVYNGSQWLILILCAMHLISLSSHSKSSSSLETMQGFFGSVDDFSPRWHLCWCGFLPPQDVIGTCTVPSVDVDDGHGICRKQALLALRRWSADICFQQSAVVQCLTSLFAPPISSIIDFPSLGITYNGGWCSATKTRWNS